MAWVKTYPTLTGDTISASPTQIQANFTAINSVMGTEHADYTSALSGTHLYGRVSTMFSGTNSALSALSATSPPNSGALAWDTTGGICLIYNGTSWNRITETYFSRLHGYRSTAQTILTSTWTTVVLNTESYDSLAEFAVGTGVTTIVAAGWYLVIGTITWPIELINDYQKIAAIYNGSTRLATDVKYGKEEIETEVVDIVNFAASYIIALKAYHSYSGSVNIAGANLIIHRLS